MNGRKRSRSALARPNRYASVVRQGPSWRSDLGGDFLAVVGYVILVGMVGGGPTGFTVGYALISLATVAFAALFAWRGGIAALGRLPWNARAALVGIAVLPLLQMIPLPPGLWRALPGQALRESTLAQVGMLDSWQPLTLEPASTALIAVLAIGFVTLVGFLLQISDSQFRRLFQFEVGLVLLGILIGLLQVVSDGNPHLQVDNMGATMLGLFANKNHMAMAIACSILMVGLVVSRDLFAQGRHRPVAIGYAGFAMVCIVTTNSRAGLALGALASVIVLAHLWRGVALRWRIAGIAAFAVLVIALLSTTAFEQVSSRVGEVDNDLRWQIAGWSWPLAMRYVWSGSGLGTFGNLFAANEQLDWVKPTFVNAAHNEYLQLVIEAGLPGVLVLVLLASTLVPGFMASRAIPRSSPARLESRAGLAIVALFALHSGFDYPLRRPATWIFFALGLAAVWRRAVAERGNRSRLPHGSAEPPVEPA